MIERYIKTLALALITLAAAALMAVCIAVMAEMEEGSSQGRRETLRECADGLRMLAELLHKTAAVAPQLKSQREAEMEALLQSAGAIARRHGAGTAWDRFSASLRAIGINGITARTYRLLEGDDEAASKGGAA